MRWKGLIPLAALVAVSVLVTTLFLDKWIESGLEKAGEAAVGAKVEIDGLDFRFSGPSIEWQRLQVADPKHTLQNLIETGRTAFRLNPGALIRKRIVIEEMTLADVRTRTPRNTDGALPKKPPKPKSKSDKPDFLDKIKAKLKYDIATMPVMKFDPKLFKQKLNLDSLIVTADLKTAQNIDSVKKDAAATVLRWDAFYKTFHPDEDLRKVQADFQGVDPKKIKTIPDALVLVEKVRSAQKSINAISDTFSVKQKAIRSDIGRLASYTTRVDDWVREDYRSVVQKAKLPDLSVRSIAKMLAGGMIVAKAEQVLGYYQTLRKYLPKKSEKPQKEVRPRFKGQDIHFVEWHAYPTFLIRKILLSGQTGSTAERPGVMLKGEILNITSQPWVIGKPTTVDLSGALKDQRSVSFQAVMDHVTEAANDSFHVRFGNVSLNYLDIPNSNYLPSQIQKGRADFEAILRFKENDFFGRLDMTAKDIGFDFSRMKTNDLFIDVIQQVLARINRITLDVTAAGRGDNLEFKVDSNLDELVSQELRKIGSRALADAETKIQARLNQIKTQKLAELEKLYADKKPAIEAALGNYNKLIGDNKSLLDGKLDGLLKEIDKRKKGEQGKLEEKAKGVLEGILKKKK
jgi:uncharacterized protein (TIGR03545 family)